jgi:hypothetical protein
MLGLDTPEEGGLINWLRNKVLPEEHVNTLKGHLVQIGTGEGKSVILGILSTVLALLGCEVCFHLNFMQKESYRVVHNLFQSISCCEVPKKFHLHDNRFHARVIARI